MNPIARHMRRLTALIFDKGATPLALYRQGVRACRNGNQKQATETFRTILDVWPEFRPARNSLLRTLVAQGALEDAQSLSRKMLSTHPDDKQALMTLGHVASQLGDHEQATIWFQQAIEGHPNFSQARTALATELFALKRNDEAEVLCKDVLSKEAKHYQALMTLAMIARSKNIHRQALAWLRKVRKAHPDSLEARVEIASSLMDLKRYAGAATVCRAILQEDTNNVRAHAMLAMIPSRKGNHALTLKRFQTLRRTLPDAFDTHIEDYDECKVALCEEILHIAAKGLEQGKKALEERIDAICAAYAHTASRAIGGRDIGNVLSFIETLKDGSNHRDRRIWSNESNLFVAEVPDAEDVVLTFRTGLELPVLDAFLSRYRCSHIHISAQEGLNWGLSGINGFSNSFEESIPSLRSIIDQLGAKRLIVVGFSGYGLTAIQYGIALEADIIVGFSAITNFEIPTVAKLYTGRRPTALAHRLAKTIDPALLDARKALVRAQTAPDVKLFFGADKERDKHFAQILTDLDCVTLEALPGCRVHHSLLFLMQKGTLQETLERAMEITPVPSSHWG
ncbi:tetratricopeptide repeat protein [uncultured Cohaesibacter sp.]|uniref:tetratricopeptide repeat protein n=1 Tax=uncultured Cohaesibacter sp. TaxID=1002546 RepID=UPI002AAC18E5|nr:tetratricopeptide repeat protein [uncultured Cohaesibacter sp.]